jgi:hypothetical protein
LASRPLQLYGRQRDGSHSERAGGLLKISTSWAAAIVLTSISASAFAQTITLDYQNNLVSGTYTSLPPGLTSTLEYGQTFPEAAFTGSLSGFITYSTSGGIADAEFTLAGANGTQLVFIDAPSPLTDYGNGGICDSFGNCTNVQSSNGSPVSATVNIADVNGRGGAISQLNTTPGGVSLSWEWSSSNGGCGNQFLPENMPGGDFIYNGAGIPVCSLTATSSSPGSWTVAGVSAPEIDPATAGSALTLLAGFAAMMRGRRRAAA